MEIDKSRCVQYLRSALQIAEMTRTVTGIVTGFPEERAKSSDLAELTLLESRGHFLPLKRWSV